MVVDRTAVGKEEKAGHCLRCIAFGSIGFVLRGKRSVAFVPAAAGGGPWLILDS